MKGVKGFQKGDLNPMRTPEARAAVGARRRGKVTPPETKKKISQAMLDALNDPELRKKWSEVKKGHRQTNFAKKGRKVSTMKAALDKIFSKYIRKKYEKDGLIPCFTCDKRLPLEEMDNGHYVSRQYLALRYSERNCHPQCRSCNRFHEGVKDIYALRLIEKYGQGILEELNRERNKITKDFPYETLIPIYKDKAAELGWV